RVVGHEHRHATPREMLDAGVGHIPEDRQRRGLVLEFTIAENIALHDYAEPPDAKWGWLFPARLVERARTLIKQFDVRGGGPLTRAGGLSGGNQQKVVAAREIARDPKVLIAAQPTRGLDVRAREDGVSEPDPTIPPVSPEQAAETGTLAARISLRQRSGGIIVPVFTVVIAFLIGGLVVAATGHNPLTTYHDIFDGAGLNWFG